MIAKLLLIFGFLRRHRVEGPAPDLFRLNRLELDRAIGRLMP